MEGHIGQPMGLVGSGPAPNDRLLGNYRILRLLGQGSFADVYLGEHIHLGTQAAIKVLQVRLVESNIQSFLNEARTIAHLVHPYIIRVLDFGVEANMPFLVMDYAPQGTFRQRFLQGKPLPPTPLFPSIKQAASALQYAHDKKLIHRDVKPENMLLGPNDEILLSDFGFALMQTSVPRFSPEAAGTASYMAPEQFQGNPQPASDQYSLGVIAYEWLAGVCPFQGTFMELASQHMFTQPPSLLQRVPGLPVQVAQVVMSALAKEPSQRFPTVRDFARALEHACLSSTSNINLTSSTPVPPPFLTMDQTGRNVPPVGGQARGIGVRGGQAQGTVPTGEEHFQSSQQSPAFRSDLSAASELPPLPQMPSLAPELALQNRQGSMVSQALPVQQTTSLRTRSLSRNFPASNGTASGTASVSLPAPVIVNEQQSVSSASGQTFSSLSTSAVRSEDAWKTAKSSTSRTLYFFAIFMVVLIIGSTTILIMLTNNQNNSLIKANANQQQATPHTNATATTVVRTPIATAPNLAEQNPYGDHNGILVLNNPLHLQDQQLQWTESPGACAFNAGYHTIASPQGFTLCTATASDYANFVYQVQMTFTKGTVAGGSGGLVFRGNKTNSQFYFFEIFTNGNYAFYRCPGTNGACVALSTSALSGIAPLPTFHTEPNQPNTIAMVANGSTFNIYVNNQLVLGPIVDTVTDATYSHGRIGMMARQVNPNAGTDVAFSDIKIWKL